MDIKVSDSGALTIEGKIINLSEIQQSTKSDYRWRTIVLEVADGKYAPQQLPIKFGGKSCDKVEDVHEGDFVKVSFALEGNEWNGRWYSSLRGFACTINVPASVIVGEEPSVSEDAVLASVESISDDDMPF